MTKKELAEALVHFDDDAVVVCMDCNGGWDNIETVEKFGASTAIVFGGGSPFRDEHDDK